MKQQQQKNRFYIVILLTICLCDVLQLQNKVEAAESNSREKLNSRILQDSIVKKVNEHPNAGWKASINPKFSNYTVSQFKNILGVKPTPQSLLDSIPVIRHNALNLPKEFDARKAWSQCDTISRILDQGHCGSCWAFAAVEALSDRFCIKFGTNTPLSVNDLLACCGSECGFGCGGGFPIVAWQYLVENGVVTEECDPYFDDKGCPHPGCGSSYPTPECVRECVSKDQEWSSSKHFSADAYLISPHPQDIMTELYTNGPIEVAFYVYEDFAHYKSGVYKHVTGDFMGGHAVKLIGWGTFEDGEDYWLVANSWNKGWGEDGFFKIIRGTNECGIEVKAIAGMPSAKKVTV